MSEYIIGDRIEPSAQPYTLTAADLEAVGIRVYGDSNGVGYPIQGHEGYYAAASITMDDKAGIMSVGSAALDEGEHQDVFEWALGVPPAPADLDHPTAIKDGMATLSTSDTIRMIGGATEGAQPQPILAPFSFIYEGGTHMTTITDRIATIEVDGSETVKFAVSHDVYGVYGEDIIASLKEGASEGDQGAYSTAGTGKAIIAHYTGADTLYLTGSGTVTVWAGQSPLDDPFAV